MGTVVESPLRTLVLARSPAEGSRLTYPLLRAGLKVGARRVAEVDELEEALRRGAPAGLDWELVLCPALGGPAVAAVGDAVRRSDREASIVAVELPDAATPDDDRPPAAASGDAIFLTADATGEEITQRVRREVEIGAMRRSARASAAGGDLRDHALASVRDAIVIADAVQQGFPTVYVNPAFERMTGWAQRQILGQSCAVLQGPETDPEAIAELSGALAEGREVTVTLLNHPPRRDQLLEPRVADAWSTSPTARCATSSPCSADVTEEVTARARLEAAQARQRPPARRPLGGRDPLPRARRAHPGGQLRRRVRRDRDRPLHEPAGRGAAGLPARGVRCRPPSSGTTSCTPRIATACWPRRRASSAKAGSTSASSA